MSDAEVLAAFREATGWSDDDVLHYATCNMCDPLGSYEGGYSCSDSPIEQQREQHRPAGEPIRPQPQLPAGLRRASS